DFGHILQHVSALLPAGCDHGQRALHEPAAGRGLGPVAGLPPADCVAERPLGCVVCRLYALDRRERVQGRLDCHHLSPDPRRRPRAPPGRAPPPPPARGAKRADPPPTDPPEVGRGDPGGGRPPPPPPPPLYEQDVGVYQQILADRRPVVPPVDHGLKITT